VAAYEMKVSGKNPTHEFFKDVFKAIEHNLSGGGQIKCLVFLTDRTGVARLQRGIVPLPARKLTIPVGYEDKALLGGSRPGERGSRADRI